MEPDAHYFEPFIKPLLDQPGSTYRYAHLDIEHSSSYWKELHRVQADPNLLPPKPVASSESSELRQFDPSVLVIGNIARQIRSKATTHTLTQHSLVLHQLAQHALANQYFQSAGLVRMLLWVPEEHKPNLLAPMLWLRSSSNLGLSLAFNINETAHVQSLDVVNEQRLAMDKVARRRSIMLDVLNADAVNDRMKRTGMTMPEGRIPKELESLSPPDGKLPEARSPLVPARQDPTEIQSTIDEINVIIDDASSWVRGIQHPGKLDSDILEYPQVTELVAEFWKLKQQSLNPERLMLHLDVGLRLINVEATFKEFEESDPAYSSLQTLNDNVLALGDKFNKLIESCGFNHRNAIRDILDEQTAYFASPSLLTLYDRSYEPLKANSSEFWPNQNLALFDLIPKERDLTVPGLATSAEAGRIASEFLKSLFASRNMPLPQALDKVAVNAAQDLIPKVPAITDARRGGRLDPNNIRVRMITEEMVEGLVKAFFEWPFRPESWELELANTNLHSSDQAEMEEPSH